MSDVGNGNGTLSRMLLNGLLGLLGAALLTVIAWNANAIISESKEIATMGERISALEAVLPLRTALRYTSDDAARDREENQRRFQQLEDDLRELQHRPSR